MNRYFALISGEYPLLARAEIETLLDLCCPQIQVAWSQQLAIYASMVNPTSFLVSRAALLREAGTIIFEAESIEGLSMISDVQLMQIVGPSETFAVRTISLSNEVDSRVLREIPSQMGARIRRVTGARVDLEKPDIRVIVIVMFECILVCKSMQSWLRRRIRERKPSKKKWFHPSMMNAELARVMCNLAGVLPGKNVLDPFCGGGGILCEIATIGARPIGMDLSWRFLAGARQNLESIVGTDFSLVQGDVRYLPIHECDHIVTDPPYGRTSSTRGSESRTLVASLLTQLHHILVNGGTLCVCGSAQMDLPDMIHDAGLKLEKHLRIRVHSGLVREIVTARI